MRKVEAQMIQAIRAAIGAADRDGVIMRSGNTTVEQSHHGVHGTAGYQRIISVRLHGNEIAAIRPAEGTVWVSDCGWRTVTTKSRINTIIGALTAHASIAQVAGEWLQIHPCGARYAWKGQDVFPLRLAADSYWLQQAERIAA